MKVKADLFDLKLEAWFRARESGKLVWVTKEGKQVPIKEMTDTHLANTINMLERNFIEELNLEDAIESFDWDKFGY